MTERDTPRSRKPETNNGLRDLPDYKDEGARISSRPGQNRTIVQQRGRIYFCTPSPSGLIILDNREGPYICLSVLSRVNFQVSPDLEEEDGKRSEYLMA